MIGAWIVDRHFMATRSLLVGRGALGVGVDLRPGVFSIAIPHSRMWLRVSKRTPWESKTGLRDDSFTHIAERDEAGGPW